MIIGIDTSCYTTSVAVIGENGVLHAERRQMLRVKPGKRGLRQSEAVFQHLQNFPRLVEDLKISQVKAVIASSRPRPVSGSYLPVFKVGAALGETLARVMGVAFFETSHQEGHLRAGFFDRELPDGPFLAWHLSGGTTELLLVKGVKGGFDICKVGGSSDLQVGQFVDRIGVALGGPFPAGAYLEKLARQSDTLESLPVAIKDLTISFSGPDSAAKRLLDAGITPQELARRVFNCIVHAIAEVTAAAADRFQVDRVLLAGGVASADLIRTALLKEAVLKDVGLIFAPKELSGDNAVGVGLIGYDLINLG
ncbi:MAG: O-sialoglycoprotein endopeptidase [Firmicutes bacterium]|nr:O-sialoglycoprotein endopeptidase [Bacillota bacterium]